MQERARRDGPQISVVPDGWQLLGLDQTRALEIFKEEKKNRFVTDAAEIYGSGGYKVNAKGQRVDEDGKLVDAEDIERDERSRAFAAVNVGKPPPTGKVYKCDNCGFLVYVPDSKDFAVDYPADYICFECRAEKHSFKLLEFEDATKE